MLTMTHIEKTIVSPINAMRAWLTANTTQGLLQHDTVKPVCNDHLYDKM